MHRFRGQRTRYTHGGASQYTAASAVHGSLHGGADLCQLRWAAKPNFSFERGFGDGVPPRAPSARLLRVHASGWCGREILLDVVQLTRPAHIEVLEPYRDFVRHLLRDYDLQHLNYDAACRLLWHGDPPQGCSWPQLHVDWLHSHAHNEACLLSFSSMYHEGLGRTVGSLTENLWAWCMSFWKSMAKMTQGHAIDFLQFMLNSMMQDVLLRWAPRLYGAQSLSLSACANY